MRLIILIADFAVGIVLALLTNIIANYIQQQYGLLTDQLRIGLVILVFILTIILGLMITFILARRTELDSKTAQGPKKAGLFIGDEAITGEIHVDNVAAQDINDSLPTKAAPVYEKDSDGIGVYVGPRSKVKDIRIRQIAGRNILKRRSQK